MKQEIGMCLFASHVTLVIYWLVTATTDAVLYIMSFITGIGTIILFSSTAMIVDIRNFIIVGVIGVSTFIISTTIAIWVPIFSAVFKWAIGVAFTMGTLNSMRLVDAKSIVMRNVIYHTLTLILNIIYALLTGLI